MTENKDTGAKWEIQNVGRINEGHGQTGLEVTLQNKDLPFQVKISAPMAQDQAVTLAAEYVKTVLNLMDINAVIDKSITQKHFNHP